MAKMVKKEETAPYRYKGGPGKHHVPDPDSESGLRHARKGEVVQLTASQYENCKDRFEPVSKGKGRVTEEEEVVEVVEDDDEIVDDDDEEPEEIEDDEPKKRKKGKKNRK